MLRLKFLHRVIFSFEPRINLIYKTITPVYKTSILLFFIYNILIFILDMTN